MGIRLPLLIEKHSSTKPCFSTNGKYVCYTGEIKSKLYDFSSGKYVCTSGKNNFYRQTNSFSLYGILFPLPGKKIVHIKISFSVNWKCASNTEKNNFTGKILPFH